MFKKVFSMKMHLIVQEEILARDALNGIYVTSGFFTKI